MPFCRSCGAPVEGQFCAKCGTPAAASAAGAGTAAGAAPAPDYVPPAQPYNQAGAAVPAQAGAGGMTDNVAGLLCYVLGFITGILFLVLEPYNRNKFVRFHAFQSIFYNIAAVAVMIGLSIVGIMLRFIPMMWALIGMLHMIAVLAILVGWVILMIKAYQGQKFSLPIIGPLAEKQA